MKNKWFIAIKKNDGDVFNLDGLKELPIPDGKYYADPFLFENYLFFEEYDYKKGKISVCTINDDLTITDPVTVLERPYHLSFPHLFTQGEDVFMIPETGGAGRIELYKASEFPYKWELVKTIADVRASDCVIHSDEDGFYLLTTCGDDLDNNLLVLHTDNLFNDWVVKEHIKVDFARPAGNIFEKDGKLIMPTQDSVKLYGNAIVFKEVDFKNGWKENIISRIEPTWDDRLIGTHTFNFNDDYVVVDGKIRIPKDGPQSIDIYSVDEGEITITPKSIRTIKSTHVDKPQRKYEVWDDYFILHRHDPWIDPQILNDDELIQRILEYTQNPDNNIVPTYKIDENMIVTKWYDDWYPLIIKSANNFYDEDVWNTRRTRHFNRFKDLEHSQEFYNSVISKHFKIFNELGVSFEDVAPNNIMVNEDLSDYVLIDIPCLRKTEPEQVKRYLDGLSMSQVIYGDGANDIGFVDSNRLLKYWKNSKSAKTDKDIPMSFCISTFNNLKYLKIAIDSVRKNSYYYNAPFIIHAENCEDGTDEWLKEHAEEYDLEYYIDKNDVPLGIGGGMNFCAERVKTEYIMFLHSDFYVTKDWDRALLDVFEQHPDEKLWVNSHRVEPKMFSGQKTRQGTVVVPQEIFGAYHHDFQKDSFEQWAKEFMQINDFQVPKGEGVSGLIRKCDWDEVGGNDSLFAPASFEDIDLFLRMLQSEFRFILPSTSMVWHFGARGSHRLEENDGKSSTRQLVSQTNNQRKWLQKWGSLPKFDKYGMICGLKGASWHPIEEKN